MKRKRNIKLWPLALMSFLMLTLAANAQLNVVGYYTLFISPGDNLIANQFYFTPDNAIDDVLTNGMPVGASFTEQDPTTHQLLPSSIWNGSSWTINYDLAPNGVGGVLHSPVGASVIMAGEVENFGQSGYTFVPPTRGPGTYLLAMAAPITGDFQQIVGRDPLNGDAVETLNAATQTYQTTTFLDGTWNNGTPDLVVGQAAYFELQVPEPSTLLLTGVGLAALIGFRNSRPQVSRK